ncbi:Glutamate synthase domain 2 and ferredoxin domain [Methanonatronarchaeum thermophilum]|uniref:Archaeal glutamate synthase [NADPH] n=1 Tax=Methanonatronarchaeum thermophilum TaxID=1927129 RepID=A0A1Y3GDQ6_9EURY|nr:glutamate synthase-related protein [Methanonatronarchaeum thermophilum]OUJ19357.1 Glutamate synthase domain 2 and ferredoxin domain [Methanonatronarchaeum thermophilum]
MKNKPEIMINPQLCINCKQCIKKCPEKALTQGKNKPKTHPEKCIKCKECIETCSQNAIKIKTNQTTNHNITQIRKKTKTDHCLIRGGKAKTRHPTFNDITILPAQISRPPIDKYREECNTKVTIGNRYAEQPLKLDIPIILPAMSYGAISIETKIAFAIAANNTGTATNTGEGGMHPKERKTANKLISQYASGRFGVSSNYLKNSEAIEIKIGQGAKAGMGGHLSSDKITPEIAKIRGIPENSDALSPSRHIDIVGPEDLKMKIEQLREIVDHQKPIIVKFSAGRVKEDVAIAAKAGADAIAIDGMQAGTGAGPEIVIEHAGIPTLPAIAEAATALKQNGYKQKVSLIAGGGITNGADITKALALGADACYIGTAAMIAIGCNQCNNCHTGKCPKGITTQNPKTRKKLNPKTAGEKLTNYLNTITDEVIALTQQAGNTDINKLEKNTLRALTTEAAQITGLKTPGP